MKWFNHPETCEELKRQYRELAFTYHPDCGGSNEIMQEVNAEYDELFYILKDIHHNKEGGTYTSREASSETTDQFKDLINELMKMEGITIEVIGRFVWLTGNTKPYKEQLKAMKFQWHSKKLAWYLKPEDYKRQSHREYDLDEIRAMYGTSGSINSNGQEEPMTLRLKRHYNSQK